MGGARADGTVGRRACGSIFLCAALGLVAACGRGDQAAPRDVGGEGPAVESAVIAGAFAQGEATGTMLVRRLSDGREWVHDAARADTPLIPASTFKIVNAAIALEIGAVSGPDELFPWDGEVREFAAWNRDLTLAGAMTASAVPVYQEVARRIGGAAMEEWLNRLDYGNHQVGSVIDRFWLDGPLLTSAREQVDFLERMVRGELPFSPETLSAVEEMIRLEEGPWGSLHGKTGWAFEADLGWWVGWVRRGPETWVFALNMDLPRPEDAPRRVAVGRAALQAVGALQE